RNAGGPGDAERGRVGGRGGDRVGQGPLRHSAAARGGLGAVRLRRRGADRPRIPDGRRDGTVRVGPCVFLLDGRGPGGRRSRGGSEPPGRHRPDRSDHGRGGGGGAGTDGFRGRGGGGGARGRG